MDIRRSITVGFPNSSDFRHLLFIVGIVSIFNAYTFLCTIHISSLSFLPFYDGSLTDVSPLGLLTLTCILHHLQVAEKVAELCCRLYESSWHRTNLSGYAPFHSEVRIATAFCIW